MEIISESLLQTKRIGRMLAKEALKTKNKGALIFGLKGDLGSGKTAFAQGFAQGLKIREKILSPTFIIFKVFEIKKNKNFKRFYHFDCYRIENPKEILTLGFEEIISNPQNIIVIEWADRIKKLLPPNSLIIDFKFVDERTRKIIFPLFHL